MKYLTLIWAGLWRKPIRTFFTMACLVIAFVLFGLLQGVNAAFSEVLLRQKLDRLFVDPRFQQPMPVAYAMQIARVPGVELTTPVAFLPGSYQDPKNSVFVIATQPAVWLAIRPEYHLPKEQLAAMAQTRTGVIVTDWLARQNDWKTGDAVTLIQTPVRARSGGTDWRFEIVGIMRDPEETGPTTFMLANFDYYDQARAEQSGTVDRFLLRIDDARYSTRISRQIDQLFTNSGVQTRTQSERETTESQIASLGNISSFTQYIMAAVFFTLLVVTANTMMESFRERTTELAVLQTIGFSRTAILMLIFSESLALCVAAALVGLTLATIVFPLARFYVGTAILPSSVILTGTVLSIAVALVSAFVPAWRALRLSVVNALARD